MVSTERTKRIAERIKRELSELLQREIQDPRLEGVTFTDVTVDRELAFAEIYVSALDGSQRSDEILAGLEHARGYIRSELAKRIVLRQFPRLRFHWDPTYERAEKIERLLAQIERERSPQEETDDQG